MKVNTQQKAKRLTTANYHKKNSKKNEGMKMIKQKKYWSLMELLSHASSKTSFLHLKKVEDTFHWIYANTNVHSSHGKLHNQHHYRKHH